MEATEANELTEINEHGHQKKNRTALTISILAMVLAISNLGGSNAMKESTQENILAANAYSFYQAKTIRQTALKIAVSDIELQLAREPNMPAAVKELHEKKIADYKKTIDRYESEPETNDGKKELMARAKAHEHERDHAMRQDPWFDYAEGMLQIAIVLLSVSIIGGIPIFYWVGSSLGALGTFCMLNGYFLFY
jgi:hypothetical protein